MIQIFDLGPGHEWRDGVTSWRHDYNFRQNGLKLGETAEQWLDLKSNREPTMAHKFRQHVLKLLSRRLAPIA